jgi:peptide-methionine (S)-S-oxide reductase
VFLPVLLEKGRPMSRPSLPILALALFFSLAARAATLPPPAVDASLAASPGTATVVLAGGCFWGVQAVFEHVKGVTRVTAGYAGGTAETAHYQIVSSGRTGHAESVEIVYDPAQVTFGQLLRVFFAVAHDPTELDRQGPDTGHQYRSALFYATPEQQRIAAAYIAQLQGEKAFPRPIVTELAPLKGFYAAEAYHQDYLRHHPDNPYIVFNDLPKLTKLQEQFPDMWVGM